MNGWAFDRLICWVRLRHEKKACRFLLALFMGEYTGGIDERRRRDGPSARCHWEILGDERLQMWVHWWAALGPQQLIFLAGDCVFGSVGQSPVNYLCRRREAGQVQARASNCDGGAKQYIKGLSGSFDGISPGHNELIIQH